MITWLISRFLSYCTIIEFFDHLMEYSARGTVTVKPYLAPSEFVDVVDRSIPLGGLILYEILLLAVIFGIFMLIHKLVKKHSFHISRVFVNYGKLLLWLGAIGVISRVLTLISINCFLNSEYIQYNALAVSFSRDIIYVLAGLVCVCLNKKKSSKK